MCSSEVKLEDMKDHIRSVHGDCVQEVSEGMQSLRIMGFSECTAGGWGCWRAVLAVGEVFFLYSTVIDSSFYLCYMHVGCAEASSRFRYKVTLETFSTREIASICLVCPNFTDFMIHGLRNATCVVLPVTFVAKCVNPEGFVTLQYQISSSEDMDTNSAAVPINL